MQRRAARALPHQPAPLSFEAVGIPRSTLVLGKHSGRHALERRYAELGYQLGAEQLADILVYEVTSPQAFEGLRLAGRRVRRPELTMATVDHSVPTGPRGLPIADDLSAR